MTRMGEREIGAVFRRLLDNPGELAYMYLYAGHPEFHRFQANGSLVQYSTYCNQYDLA